MKRSKAREQAFMLIYQMGVQKVSAAEVLDMYKQLNDTDEASMEYISFVVHGVYGQADQLDEAINANLKGWAPDRISRISRSLTRLALFEMEKCGDVPISVAINEAVDLAKKYEDEDAASFVNGILGSISRSGR